MGEGVFSLAPPPQVSMRVAGLGEEGDVRSGLVCKGQGLFKNVVWLELLNPTGK